MFAVASSDGTFALVQHSSGQQTTLTFEEFDNLMLSQAGQIEESIEALETECIALVTSLFQETNVHPLKLDGQEVDLVEGVNKNKGLNTTLSDASGEDKVWIRKAEK